MVPMLKEMLHMEKKGGRVHILDDMKTCYVYDVYQIDREILHKLSNVSHVEIQADTTSLSGYIIKISLKPNMITKVFKTFIIMGILCGVNYYLITQRPYKNIYSIFENV
jgi:hypothetical protein